MMKPTISRWTLTLFVFLFVMFVNGVVAQEDGKKKSGFKLNYGADLVSRYIWRGSELGEKVNTPHFQPSVGLNYATEKSGEFNLSVWSSFGLSGNFIETDFSLTYELDTPTGTFGIGIIDYYFPSDKMDFFNFDRNGEGAHTIEAALTYTCVESFPLKLSLASNFHNDIEGDRSFYAETSFPFELASFSFNLFAGLTKGPSVYYGVEENKLQLINTGISITKNIYFSENFSLPVGIDFIHNPYSEKSFFVFRLSYRAE